MAGFPTIALGCWICVFTAGWEVYPLQKRRCRYP